MRIRWTPVAAADLQGIYDYLKEHEHHLARPTMVEIGPAFDPESKTPPKVVAQFGREASQTRDYCVAKYATHRGSPRSLAAQRTLARDGNQIEPLPRLCRFPHAPAWAVASSVDALVGTTTTVNQYSEIDRITRRNCSKSIGLTM
jgi:plasmid stabilization system protein ParE